MKEVKFNLINLLTINSVLNLKFLAFQSVSPENEANNIGINKIQYTYIIVVQTIIVEDNIFSVEGI